MNLPSADWNDDDPENPPPVKPKGLDLNLWLDVGPMRPDEFRKQRAMPWTQAAKDQFIHREAVADVAQEAQGFSRLASGPAAQTG